MNNYQKMKEIMGVKCNNPFVTFSLRIYFIIVGLVFIARVSPHLFFQWCIGEIVPNPLELFTLVIDYHLDEIRKGFK